MESAKDLDKTLKDVEKKVRSLMAVVNEEAARNESFREKVTKALTIDLVFQPTTNSSPRRTQGRLRSVKE